MIENKGKLVPFLNGLALFQKLSPTQVENLLVNFEQVDLEPGQRLFSQGEPGDSLYIVVSGEVRISQGLGEQERELAHLYRGDIFGEEAVLYQRPRNATVAAVDATRLLRLDKAKLENILHEYPHIRPYLVATVNSRRLVRQRPYSPLAPGETVYLMARKHTAFLYVVLIPPILLGWLSVPFLLGAWALNEAFLDPILTVLGVIVLVLALLWGIWRWVDWGNDYYIVTNQRVIWIEKVVWLYESKQEAPLTTILTVITQQDQIGRWLGYGDVVVRTFTGQIILQKVGLTEQLAAMILELQGRAHERQKKAETEALEREIRTRLGLDQSESKDTPEKPTSAPAPAKPPSNPGAASLFFQNIFTMRYEEKGVVIYRKHWILLLRHLWIPTLLIIVLFSLLVLRVTSGVLSFFSPQQYIIIFFLSMLVLVGWWIYGYIDWINDLYQLTPTQIIDIYKKPLGQVDRKTATLDNILSLQHTKKGILGLLLNYGDVIAMVGGTPFTFDGVYNPAGVQQDIFERINQNKLRQKEAEDARERERVAEWMAAYHRQVEAQRRGENRPKFDRNSG